MIDSAYLIVTKFEDLYPLFATKVMFDREIYALPLFGSSHERLSVRYHGLDRNPLEAFDREPALAAEIRMSELESLHLCDGSLILDGSSLNEVLFWAEQERPSYYEPIWARLASNPVEPPPGYLSAGFEPSFFPCGYFSASCDCMCFPRWHGTDPEGNVFSRFFEALNENGLFDSPDTARLFLHHYLSFDWTERGDFEIVEVFVLE